MKWSIITDSSCDLRSLPQTEPPINFAKVPFTLRIGQTDYVDDASLDLTQMLTHMEECATAGQSSCPSPAAWCEQLEQADQTIAITISSNLSGSYNSAVTARKMILEKSPEKKIYVLDSRSAGSALAMYAEKAVQLIREGWGFDAVVSRLEDFSRQTHTIFALASFDNLVKNGRVGRLAGFIAGKLGIWGIGVATKEGTIAVKEKTRGLKRILEAFINDMKENDFRGGDVVISHCQNEDTAKKLQERITELWQTARIKILTTGGLCSFYAERHGLIVAY